MQPIMCNYSYAHVYIYMQNEDERNFVIFNYIRFWFGQVAPAIVIGELGQQY